MARWELTEPHYLNVPGTEWEYMETSIETGKSVRKRYPVPDYIDSGVVVCDGTNPQRGDVVFVGPPGPNMTPLDDEAKALSAAESHKWVHPIESLPGQNFSQSLVTDLSRQLAEAASQKSESAVSAVEFKALQDQVAQLMARNAELESRRRV